MKLINWLATFLVLLPTVGLSEQTLHEVSQVDNDYLIIKNLINGKVMAYEALDCRPDGFRCRSTSECCGVCYNDVCEGANSSGCRPDGAVCNSTSECCGVCSSNVCEGANSSGCRPAGLACRNTAECCGVCRDGVCD